MDITSDNTEKEYYKNLLPYLAKINALSASVLYYQDSPIAYNLCYIWQNKVGQIKTSYDAKYHSDSPGAILMEFGLKEYIDKQLEEFDFLGDAMPHKLSWSKEVRKHVSFYTYSKNKKAKLLFKLKSLKSYLKSYL